MTRQLDHCGIKMSDNVTNYVAPPTVAKMMQSDARVRLIVGPAGSGKSVGCLIEILRRASMQAPGRDGIRRTRWAIVRNVKQQLRDTTLRTWLEWVPPGVAGTWRETDMTFTVQYGDVYAEVLFRALDDASDVQRLLSLEITGFFCNESVFLPETIVTTLLSRCGRYPSKKEGGPTWYGGLLDSNAPNTDHWLYDRFVTNPTPGWELFMQPSGLSPEAENIGNLPPGYYTDMAAGNDEDWVNVYVHAKWGRSKQGMPVYGSTWKTEFHTRDTLIVQKGEPVIIGLDAGRTPAASFFQRDARGRVLLLDEITSENMGMENFLASKVKPLLISRYPGHRVVVGADPACWQKSQLNETSVADVIKNAGLYLPKPYDTSNRIPPRLQAVESLLRQQIGGEAMFLVDKSRCPQAVAGFEHAYRYKRKKDGQYEEVPDKTEASHLADSIQYGCQIIDSGARALGNTTREVEKVSMRGWT